MSALNIPFILTTPGKTASFNNGALDLEITHIQFGAGNKTPDGSEEALITPKEYATISSTLEINAGQHRIAALIAGSAENYNVSEIGLWSGAPGAGGSVLVFYWSVPSGVAGFKTPSVDFNFETDIYFGGVVPSNITIVADTEFNALSMIAAHNADLNAHQLAFASLLASPGYCKIAPGGIILQWGSVSVTSPTQLTQVTYPIAMSAVYFVGGTHWGTAGAMFVIDNAETLTGFDAIITTTGGGISGGLLAAGWFALGKL